jgi:large subunit ribosomal protein L30
VTRLVIRQHRSSIGEKIAARRTLQALGLRRTGQSVEQTDSNAVRGMLRRVAHLVEVSEESDKAESQPSPNPGKAGQADGTRLREKSGTE